LGYMALITASTTLMSWVSTSVQKRIWACRRPLFDTRFSIQSSSKRKVWSWIWL
jgi:hypothetical protein